MLLGLPTRWEIQESKRSDIKMPSIDTSLGLLLQAKTIWSGPG